MDDLAMNAYLLGYIAALRTRHRPDEAAPENPCSDPAQHAGWFEGYQDAIDEFGGLPTRQSLSTIQSNVVSS
ncbi:MAG: hypothetical protein ABW106_08535 [Steroidobacteraceae bacterium]